MRTFSALAATLLAACGGGSDAIEVRGEFAGGPTSPGRVYALEARVDAEVRDGAFEIGGLATSPISLRLVQSGDTVGRIDVAELPSGSRLVLHGLRTDARSGRTFPSSVEITGAQAVRVNGIRMMNADALPGTVDADGTVLAASADRSALLVRPTSDELPDLRVSVSPSTSVLTRDSLDAKLNELSVGDSIHVNGTTQRGVVFATQLILPTSLAAPTVSLAEDAPRTAQRAPGRGRPPGRGHGKGRKKPKG